MKGETVQEGVFARSTSDEAISEEGGRLLDCLGFARNDRK